MVVELINTGSELLLGRVLNTHQFWLCRQLADLGYLVSRQVAVPDSGAEIQAAVQDSLSRADLVIVTGGLGPTSDDLTRQLIAELLGKELHEDPAVLAKLTRFFEARGRTLSARARVQAQVPEGARVLANLHGTAPGLAIEVQENPFHPDCKPRWLILLPGPTRELRPMFIDSVVPLLLRVLPNPERYFCRTLRATGIAESLVEEAIAGPLQPLVAAALDLGYCARLGQVDVRLAARGPEAERLVGEAEAIVREKLAPYLYGEGEEDIEATLVRLLTNRNQTVALAESCTGGCISHRLTNVPGASAVFAGGFVTYSNAAKQKFLGVSPALLDQHGAVSEAVARQMATGARAALETDFALSVTGIAGPGGGTPAKPVGTVFIGLAGPFATEVEHHVNPWERESFKEVTAQQALGLLRRKLLPH